MPNESDVLVLNIMHEIRNFKGIPTRQQRLSYGNRVLKHDEPILGILKIGAVDTEVNLVLILYIL